MKHKELLVPVGNMEALYQAIHNGADAVYLGGKNFGARKFAANFDDEEMIEAIHICHLYGVKIYVTVNTLIFDDEVQSFLDYVKFLYINHVDAVIMQDFGMLCLVRECFPNLEVHASTQMHNHNQKGLEFLKQLGVKRAVLARELSLDEINKIKVDIEKEVFIHGALCICYSGCCLFSSLVGGRSGNRGECAGSCRLPYTLLEDEMEIKTKGQYLLSPKELSTYSHFKELMESDITSFKIEGRMKSPEYVGFITRFYRNLIDQYEKTKQIWIDEEALKELQVLFSREFTNGHLFKDTNEQLMNIKSPNHVGRFLGEVIDTGKRKITIRLMDDLTQDDGIRFIKSNKGFIVNYLYNEKDLLIHEAKKGDIVKVDNKIDLNQKDKVYKTIDSKLMHRLKNYSYRKIPLLMKVIAKVGEPFIIRVTDLDRNEVTITQTIVEKAKTSFITKEKMESQLSKLGNTPFVLKDLSIEMDEGIFLSIQKINEGRREAIEKLMHIRMYVEKDCPIHSILSKNLFLPQIQKESRKKEVTVSVMKESQLKHCLKLPFDRIYVRDPFLYQKYQNDTRIFYQMPRVNFYTKTNEAERLLLMEYGSLALEKKDLWVSSETMNVTNRYSIYYLQKYGVDIVTLSVELNDDRLKSLLSGVKNIFPKFPPLEKIVYGRVDMMIMKHCLLNHLVNQGKKPCKVCRNGKKYYLKDRKNVMYPIFMEYELTHILSSKFDQLEKIPSYIDQGLSCFRLSLFEESDQEITSLYQRLSEMIKK